MHLFASKLATLIKRKISLPSFIDSHRKNDKFFSRNRKLSFETLISTILKLSTKSLQIECELLEKDVNIMPPSKQAFSKARYKFSHTGFIELLQDSIEVALGSHPNFGLWKNYRFLAVDGSSLRLPKSQETINLYGKYKCCPSSAKQSPILSRVSLVVDICTSIIMDAALENWGVGEITTAKDLLPKVVKNLHDYNQKKLCFIYDRGYSSKSLMSQHIDLSVDFIFRIPKNFCSNVWKRVNSGEIDFIDVVDNKNVRVVVIPLLSGEKEVLLTSLSNVDFTIKDLSILYNMRWNIEECYKRLKVTTEMENFSGKNIEAILQDFWSHLLMCNFLQLMILDKDGPLFPDKLPKYKLNFSVILGVMRHKIQDFLMERCEIQELNKLFDRVIKRGKVKVRPGRKYDRNKVGIPKRHHVYRRVC